MTMLNETIKPRTFALIAGSSYWVIFFAAIFGNFVALESLIDEPLATVQQHYTLAASGVLAFLITAVFDVVVAWALYELFRGHPLNGLSLLFRMMHAVLMGLAVFALMIALTASTSEDILRQTDIFNSIWLIGLFFFGIHLILLAGMLGRPKVITFFLILAGIMYMVDTVAHFALPDYETYAGVFLTLVAVPSILGEMSFAIWLLVKGGR